MDAELAATLRPLVKERKKQAAIRDAAEARYDELGNEIGMHLTMAGLQKADFGDFSVSLSEGSRSTLSKEKLLELGVDLEIIEQTTKTSKFPIINGRFRG